MAPTDYRSAFLAYAGRIKVSHPPPVGVLSRACQDLYPPLPRLAAELWNFASRVRSRSPRNFFLQHPVIPRRWRNSLAKEHLQQHAVLDGDSMALHMQVRYSWSVAFSL